MPRQCWIDFKPAHDLLSSTRSVKILTSQRRSSISTLDVTNVCADMLTNTAQHHTLCHAGNLKKRSVNITTTYIPKPPNQVWDLQVSPTFYRGGGAGDHDRGNHRGRGHLEIVEGRPRPPRPNGLHLLLVSKNRSHLAKLHGSTTKPSSRRTALN